MKLQAFRPATSLKRDSNTGFFSVNIANFKSTSFFIEHLRWLFLNEEFICFLQLGLFLEVRKLRCV